MTTKFPPKKIWSDVKALTEWKQKEGWTADKAKSWAKGFIMVEGEKKK